MLEEGRYAPLSRYLHGFSGDDHTLSFGEIEKILDRKLPPSAAGSHGRQWWANTSTHSQGHAWLKAGWRVDRVDIEKRRVRFRRVAIGAAGALQEAGRAFRVDEVVVRLQDLSPTARRMVEDYVEACGDWESAVREAIEAAALERRRKLIESFVGRSVADANGSSSAALIREDRDAR